MVQIDAPDFFNEVLRRMPACAGADYEEAADRPGGGSRPEGAELLNYVRRLSRPPRNAASGLHVCKGNGTPIVDRQGGYEDILPRGLLKRATTFDVFHL